MPPITVPILAVIEVLALLPAVTRREATLQWRVLVVMANLPAIVVLVALGMGVEARHLAQSPLGWVLACVMAGIAFLMAYVPLFLSPGPKTLDGSEEICAYHRR